MGKCKVRKDWFLKEDGRGYKVTEWARNHSDYEVYCMLCLCTVSVQNKGFQAIAQHASTLKHQEECRIKLAPRQLRLTTSAPGTSSTVHQGGASSTITNSLQVHNVYDSTSTAELIWTMKCVASNYSASSCDGIADTFKVMFPGLVPEGFTLSRSKMRYLVADALGPYFKEQLIDDIEGAYYSLIYDETTNASGKKELQTVVRYWSKSRQMIVSQHLETFFIGQATAHDIHERLNKAIDGCNLSRNNLLMLGSDGPNVNKKVARLMKEELMWLHHRKKNLLEIGTCNIHVVHNAYLKGLAELGEDASDLVLAIYHFFDGWPVRCDDFSDIQRQLGIPTNRFIKHVASRWLTLQPAAERLLQQWTAVEKYFLIYVPQKRASLTNTNSYRKIVSLLKSTTIKAELHFVSSSAKMFIHFTGTFQRDEPLIHIIHNELSDLVHTLMGRVCKQEGIPKTFDRNCEDLFHPDNLLPLKDTVCSEEVKRELSTTTEKAKLFFLKNAQNHYVSACKHIIHKTSLTTTPLIKHFRCLQPDERLSKRSCNDIIMIAKALPVEVEYDILLDEWKLLQLETNIGNKESRIDTYWSQLFTLKNSTGNLKFLNVSKIVKAALALSHGSADVERSFSASGRMLTDDRASMSERTLNAMLTIKDALKLYDNKPHLISITKKMLALAKAARQHYQSYLEEQKSIEKAKEKQLKEDNAKKVAEEESKRKMIKENSDIQLCEEELKIKRKEEEAKRKAADKLFIEANERLKKALENKSLEEAGVAQAMLEGVSKVKKEEAKKKNEGDSIQNTLEKRKSSLITAFFNKRPRK